MSKKKNAKKEMKKEDSLRIPRRKPYKRYKSTGRIEPFCFEDDEDTEYNGQ